MFLTNICVPAAQPQHPDAIQQAIEYLKAHDFLKMEPGEYPILGRQMFAKVFDVTSQRLQNTRPELHKQYVDVQFWPEGEELMGYAPNSGNAQVVETDEENDLYFLAGAENECFIPARQGDVMVLFPDDIHRPAVQKNGLCSYRKVVVKVSVDLL